MKAMTLKKAVELTGYCV